VCLTTVASAGNGAVEGLEGSGRGIRDLRRTTSHRRPQPHGGPPAYDGPSSRDGLSSGHEPRRETEGFAAAGAAGARPAGRRPGRLRRLRRRLKRTVRAPRVARRAPRPLRPPRAPGCRRRYSDLAYAGLAGRSGRLSLPPNGTRPYPVVIGITGGGFLSGNKKDGADRARVRALKRGYAVSAWTYRLSGEARFPAAINDVKAAVRWLRAHASGTDWPQPDAVWGDSAAANWRRSPALGRRRGPARSTPRDARQSDRVQAVVDWFGPISFLASTGTSAPPASTCELPTDRTRSPRSTSGRR